MCLWTKVRCRRCFRSRNMHKRRVSRRGPHWNSATLPPCHTAPMRRCMRTSIIIESPVPFRIRLRTFRYNKSRILVLNEDVTPVYTHFYPALSHPGIPFTTVHSDNPVQSIPTCNLLSTMNIEAPKYIEEESNTNKRAGATPLCV